MLIILSLIFYVFISLILLILRHFILFVIFATPENAFFAGIASPSLSLETEGGQSEDGGYIDCPWGVADVNYDLTNLRVIVRIVVYVL